MLTLRFQKMHCLIEHSPWRWCPKALCHAVWWIVVAMATLLLGGTCASLDQFLCMVREPEVASKKLSELMSSCSCSCWRVVPLAEVKCPFWCTLIGVEAFRLVKYVAANIGIICLGYLLFLKAACNHFHGELFVRGSSHWRFFCWGTDCKKNRNKEVSQNKGNNHHPLAVFT